MPVRSGGAGQLTQSRKGIAVALHDASQPDIRVSPSPLASELAAGVSLLRMSMGKRLASVTIMLAGLWLAVYWALQ